MNEIKENNFFIPQKLAIGFQNRCGTYTGKLGYVTYYDNKGVMRKDKSWNGWRDNSIDPLYIDNVPTDGFVLNRSVGGGRGWDARDTWTRIWDPRGFEFEISIENLLWILEWSACSPGKGLEQKFVYSWRGTDLVLMPVNTEDYKASLEVSKKMYNKTSFKEKDLVPGTLYKVKGKNDNEVIFIGKVLTSTHFGKFTKPQLLFLSADTAETEYDYGILPGRWSYDEETISKYAKREIIQYKSPSSIIAELTPNYISQKEIDTYIERFNASPFSAYFWNNLENVVDRFVTRHPPLYETVTLDNVTTKTFYGGYISETSTEQEITQVSATNFDIMFRIKNPLLKTDSYCNKNIVSDNMYYLRAIISDDGKYVKLYNRMHTLIKNVNKWEHNCYELNRLYHFANIDLNTGIVEKVTDAGRSRIRSDWNNSPHIEYISCTDENEIKRAEETAFVPSLTDKRDLLYYVTKNGYVSDALLRLLISNVLTFNETDEDKKYWHNGAGYRLPIPIK